MSREIKFRVWDTFNRVMVYPKDGESFPAGYIENGKFLDQCVPLQFTGLCDKNGKEIYEGDIISINSHSCDELLVGKVDVTNEGIICEHQRYCYKYFHQIHCEICDTDSPPSLLAYYGAYQFEVIGNIYENPELLEGDHE